MVEKGDYTIKNMYQGGYSSLKPSREDGSTGYVTSAGSLGLTTDPRTANIVKDASAKLSSGIKHIELALVSKEIFDSIPRQELKEMNRLAKLTGAEVSVHGPVMDMAGMSQQGFSETQRESAERKVADVLERSQEIDPKGNIHVVFHSAEGIPGTQWETLGKDFRKAKTLIAVDRESGKMIPLEHEKKFYPGGEGGKVIEREKTPEKSLEEVNSTQWDNSLNQLVMNKERADEILRQNEPQLRNLLEDKEVWSKIKEGDLNKLSPTQQKNFLAFSDAQTYLEEINKSASSLFSKAYQFGNPDQKRNLMRISKEYRNDLEGSKEDVLGQSLAIKKLLYNLKNDDLAPEMHVSIEDFATEKSSQTFGNAAFKAYEKYGEKAPVICIENPPVGFGLSTGEDLKNLVKASRKELVKNLVERENKGEREANKIAEKLIGATWDVGHINMLRSQGFGDKEIIQESEKIAPYVKHVHLSDNFGFEHTELPMGMGNVPVKEIMEKLGQKGYDSKKIIEAGNWWQHFGEQGKFNPINASLENLGSSFYTTGVGATWAQSQGLHQGYSEGLVGQWLPQTNYDTFGTGFSQLPQELGGERQAGVGGRMGGGRT